MKEMYRKFLAIVVLFTHTCVFLSACSDGTYLSENGDDPEVSLVSSRNEDEAAWWSAYLEVIYNMQEYLVDPNDYRSNPEIYNPMDNEIYLGLHDFDSNGIPELLVGDLLTMAVFTYSDEQVQKIVDLYNPNTSFWGINGIYFKDNSVSLNCDGADGSDFVNFGFLDGKYMIGFYEQLSLPSVVMINGEESTLEEMNRIYTINFNEREPEELKERIRLVNETGTWKLKFRSGEIAILNKDLNLELIMW